MLKLEEGTLITPEVKLLEQLDKRLGGPSTWRALQMDWKKPVIVQVAPHGRIEEEVLDAFLTTCALAQEVGTARIAHIHDFGVFEDKLPFVVVEALEGRTLEQLFKKQRRLDIAALEPLAKQLAEALDDAHALGAYHHRLTTNDVVLRGTAAQGSSEVDGVIRGFAMGLLAPPAKSDEYLSPELYDGFEGDHRADLWSLGAILYRALIGRPAVELIHRRQGKWEVELPQMVVAKELRETVGPVFAKALDKDPAGRFDTAAEMVEAILAAVAEATGGDAQFKIVEVTEESLPPPAPEGEDEEEELAW